MKKFMVLLITTLAGFTGFSQKAKGNVKIDSATVIKVQYACPMHPDMVSDKPGKCPKCNMDLAMSKKVQMKMDVTKTYTCPMHSEIVSDHEGLCPKCQAQFVVDRKGSKQGTKLYKCSMHTDFASKKSGKCPICNKEMAMQKGL